MDSVLTREELQEVLGQIFLGVTEQVAGIRLYPRRDIPDVELCTVYTVFARGFQSSLGLSGENAVFRRLTCHMMQQEEVTDRDIADFTQEYFNVLCGRVATVMFENTRVASRFGIPSFFQGTGIPQGQREHFTLHFISDRGEYVKLTHYTPLDRAPACGPDMPCGRSADAPPCGQGPAVSDR